MVVLTLAVGIGSVTVTFSVIDGVLLTPARLPDSESLVTIWGRSSASPLRPLAVSDLRTLRAEGRAFEAVAGRWTNAETVVAGEYPEQIQVAYVTADYLPMLGADPAHGRLFQEGEEDAVVLDHDFWRTRLQGDPWAGRWSPSSACSRPTGIPRCRRSGE